MTQVFKMATPFVAVFLLAACGNNGNMENKTENKEEHDHAAMEMEQKSPQQPSQSIAIKDDQLNAVYQHYVHLTTALTNSDVAEAKIASNAIEAGAKEMEGGNAIAASAAKITAAPDIETQRTVYATLSNEMIASVKKAGLNSGELYIDYCPMASNNKGAYWISANKEIKNPYMGEKMLTCGEVKETIK